MLRSKAAFFGKATVIDELRVTWPTTGKVQVFTNVAPGQFIRIKEGIDQIEKMQLARLEFKHKDAISNMISCMPAK